jgi:hypothetical protein
MIGVYPHDLAYEQLKRENYRGKISDIVFFNRLIRICRFLTGELKAKERREIDLKQYLERNIKEEETESFLREIGYYEKIKEEAR